MFKSKYTTDEPLQAIPDHTVDTHGSVSVSPSVVQDHIVWVEIDSTLVAAMKPHRALSWGDGHTSDGSVRSVTVVKHKGAHVNNGLVAESERCKWVNVPIAHKLDGTVPIKYYNTN